jgi:hypothetical protein
MSLPPVELHEGPRPFKTTVVRIPPCVNRDQPKPTSSALALHNQRSLLPPVTGSRSLPLAGAASKFLCRAERGNLRIARILHRLWPHELFDTEFAHSSRWNRELAVSDSRLTPAPRHSSKDLREHSTAPDIRTASALRRDSAHIGFSCGVDLCSEPSLLRSDVGLSQPLRNRGGIEATHAANPEMRHPSALCPGVEDTEYGGDHAWYRDLSTEQIRWLTPTPPMTAMIR